MTTTTIYRVRTVVSVLVAGCLIAGTIVSNAANQDVIRRTSPSKAPKLRKPDRLRLIEARAQGKKEVTLLLAAITGANRKVVEEVIRGGGKVQYRDDDVDYLRVKVPADAVEKIAESPAVESVNVDGAIVYVSQPPVQASDTTKTKNHIPPPDRNTPAENPYLPSRDLGAPQFISAHPTFDGRGVTVAVIDTSIDLLTPELQTAKTLDGKTTRKFLDVRNAAENAIDPQDDRGRLSSFIAVDMQQELRAESTSIVYGDAKYTLPVAGTYRMGTIDERMNGNAKGDLNLDDNPPGSNGQFGVLWNEKTNTVWVDTDQDRSFADEQAMTDFRANGDVGVFGRDDPASARRKTVAFTVQTDPARHLLFVTPGLGIHGTAVMGSSFGKGFFGGSLNGVAPEAQLVVVPFLGITHSLVESLILAVKHPNVDIVTMQTVYHTGLNDGQSTLSRICDRLVDRYKKPIFAGAGNAGDEVNIVQEVAASPRIITVGSYISRETSRVNYGVASTRADNVDLFSSRGPTETGVLKPDILAPTMALTTFPRFLPSQTYNDTYDAPVGYGVVGGTSTATPMAAAGTALLISAAKQSGVTYDAARLRWAITSTARFLPEYGAYEQGSGLVDVNRAWEALKRAKEPVEIVSRAPVRTVLARYLNEPNYGPGLYEREGWTAGQRGERTISLTRMSGVQTPVTYGVRWIGNDGTFSCQRTLSLPLGQPVDITVTIQPGTAGVHSAIMVLDEVDGLQSCYRMMTTVVAAENFTAANHFNITHDGAAEWMDGKSYYFNVPAESSALTVTLNLTSGNARLLLVRPSGEPHYRLATYSAEPCKYQTGGSCSLVAVNPEPGVWQAVVENKNARDESRFAPQNRATFTMSASLLRVRMTKKQFDVDARNGVDGKISVEFTNHGAAFTGGVMTSLLGTAFTARPALTPMWVRDIDVPVGTQNLRSVISSDSSGDLDVYLFDCSTGQCVLKDFSQHEGSEEDVEFEQPSPGKWKVVIDPFLPPTDSSGFEYADLLTNAAFGEIAAVDAARLRVRDSTWTEVVRLSVDAVPIGSRHLAGFLMLKLKPANTQSADVVLKQSLVRIQNAAALISQRQP
jgi:hypothetical protein